MYFFKKNSKFIDVGLSYTASILSFFMVCMCVQMHTFTCARVCVWPEDNFSCCSLDDVHFDFACKLSRWLGSCSVN